MKKIMNMVLSVVSMASMAMLSGCAGSASQSRATLVEFGNKSYELQMKGDAGVTSRNISFVVNNEVIAEGKVSQIFSPTITLEGKLEKHLFESECSSEITAGGWGKLTVHCNYYANKKQVGNVTF